MKTLIAILCLALATCQSSKNQDKTVNTQSPAYKAYMSQKHRFALNGCELTYNEKPFKIGMTLEEAVEVFGRDYQKNHDDLIEYWKETLYVWIDDKNNIKGIRIYLNKKAIDYLLIDNMIVKKNDRMQDFEIDDEGYGYDDTNCSYFFYSSVFYERIGSGHLYTRGEWKLNETNPIDAITVAYKQ